MVCKQKYHILWCYAGVYNLLISFAKFEKRCYNVCMKIKIEKQKRKTVCLKVVDSQNAILKVPKSYSDAKVEEFLKSKSVWLERTSAKLKQREMMSKEFDLAKFVYFDAKKVMQTSQLALGFEQMPKSKKENVVKKAYLSMFAKLQEQVESLSIRTGLKYVELKPTDSVRIWGSYNSKGVMKLNYKLVILPQNLVEYVIVHELCHSKYMNHKPQFWQEVSKFLPDYKFRRKELKNFSFLLKRGIF